jgi:U4/U6.U5 tri-snRNP-associated protein 2
LFGLHSLVPDGEKSEVKMSLPSAKRVKLDTAQSQPGATTTTTASTIPASTSVSSVTAQPRKKCPYLDTVNRQFLDFDMEKLCSVTLTNMNVYGCLICGKFFQGRGQHTPAYTHSVQAEHFVFINLQTGSTYCLPDNYEIIDSSLDDCKRCLKPTFLPTEVTSLDHSTLLARDVHGVAYLPGFVGLNNLTKTDYVNVTLHALSHITPIRDFFLDVDNYRMSKSVLVHAFGAVIRKLWSRHNFKSVVSPQDFMQVVSTESQRKFNIGKQAEAIEFMAWLLNGLHLGLGGTRKSNSSVIYKTFQGKLELTTLARNKVVISEGSGETLNEEEKRNEGTEESEAATDAGVKKSTVFEDEGVRIQESWEEKKTVSPFLYLSLDIPATPLFKDSEGGLIIPQIPLFEVLKKIDGETWTDSVTSDASSSGLVRKKYDVQSLPPYLILHLNRFTKNNFYLEKNPTIVTFPVKNLELRSYLHRKPSPLQQQKQEKKRAVTEEQLNEFSVKELKDYIKSFGTPVQCRESSLAIEKTSILELCKNIRNADILGDISTKYDLIANVCHDTAPSQGVTVVKDSKTKAKNVRTESVLDGGSYRVHTLNKGANQWYELQDLHVTETMPQLISLSESYMLIYELKK